MGKSSSESGALAKGGDDCVKMDFGLSSAQLSAEAKKAWPYEFGLVYSVTLGKDGLQTMLNVRNEGKEAFEFQMLLHTYFKVDVSGRITPRRLEGLVEALWNVTVLTSLVTGHFKGQSQRSR